VANREIGKHVPEVVWHCEKPLLRTAPVPMFMLSDAVRRSGYKVVLTGEGADEIFGGYDIFREALLRRFWSRQPDSRLRPLLFGKLYPDIFNDPRLRSTLQSFFRKGFERHDDPFYSHRLRWENTSRNRMFFSEEMKRATLGHDGLEELERRLPDDFAGWDPLAKAQYMEMVLFLGNYLLSSQGDRVAMAHSLEIRLPYLDYRLVEFLGKVPAKWKIFGMREKYLLKKMYKDAIPESVVRRPKHPYRAPILEGLLTGEQEEIRTALSESALRKAGVFDPMRVSRLLEKVRRAGQASEVEGMAIAGIASTQILSRQYIEEFPVTADYPLSPTVFVDRRTNPAGWVPDCSFTNS
jgi:asparagine synthase (glutamine-hydrolysing)